MYLTTKFIFLFCMTRTAYTIYIVKTYKELLNFSSVKMSREYYDGWWSYVERCRQTNVWVNILIVRICITTLNSDPLVCKKRREGGRVWNFCWLALTRRIFKSLRIKYFNIPSQVVTYNFIYVWEQEKILCKYFLF